MLRASLLRASIAPFLISSVSTMALAAQPSEEPTMSNHSVISTDKAPQAIGTYSQAIKAGATVYLSGQIALIPETMEIVEGGIEEQIHQVFKNLSAVCEAAGGSLQQIAKLNIFLTDLGNFATVNAIMAEYFQQPYPARAAIGVKELPKAVGVEMDGVLELD